MHELALVRDLAVAWFCALLLGAICVRLKLPVLAGYIFAGILIGPYGARLISAEEHVKVLAELGVALLLFALGVEISVKRIFGAAHRILLAAALQMVCTVALAWSLGLLLGVVNTTVSGLTLGFICALSSTAVVTKLLVDRGETESTHGRLLIPMLLVQDLSLIPVVALLPALSAGTGSITNLLLALFKGGILILIVFIGAVHFVPKILAAIAKINSRELFLLTAITLCLGVALVSKELGVSLALGAFLGGMMVSERPYGHQVLADILPLRDLFATLFFVSVGMLLNPVYIADHWVQVTVFVAFLMFAKAVIAGLAALVAVRSLWTACLVGLGLAQIGEFSFVLASLAYTSGYISEELYNFFFAGAVISLGVSTSLIVGAPKLLAKIPYLRLHRRFQARGVFGEPPSKTTAPLESHLVLCGFGRMGRNIGLTLLNHNVPFLAIEIDSEIIDELNERNIPHIYGDAFSQTVIAKANITKASCLVITIPDSIVTMNIISYARAQNSRMRIIARANSAGDVDLFRAAGANAVVQPEFEASIEATRLALVGMGRSRAEVNAALDDIRRRGYMIFRPDLITEVTPDFQRQDFFGQWFQCNDQICSPIHELDVRKRTGATILAIKRDQTVMPNPDPSTALQANDQLYVAGNESQLSKFESTYCVSRFCPFEEVTSNDMSGELSA